jgi:hypothetical protein
MVDRISENLRGFTGFIAEMPSSPGLAELDDCILMPGRVCGEWGSAGRADERFCGER